MTSMADTAALRRTPWHLWVVGILSLLWNAFGGYDYVMTLTRGEAYWRENGMNDAMVAYYNAEPTWMYAPWTMGVWGAILGSVLLLLRSRWAVWAFGVSLIGAVVNVLYTFVLANGMSVLGGMVWMTVVIVVVAAFLLWYATAMRRRGVLR